MLRGETGRDLLSALPLVTAHVESTTVLGILRRSLDKTLMEAKKFLGIDFSLIAFGSLGRLEFVSWASDLDPIILVEGSTENVEANDVRSAVLAPLARLNPWLILDERDKVAKKQWSAIPALDIRFPVIGTDALCDPRYQANQLMWQRRWQILLEGRPLFNYILFNTTYNTLLPHVHDPYSLPELESGSVSLTNFRQLTETGVTFFSGFDNPIFLYKSAYKYWKTRFLRDFFVFSTQLLFVLGWYIQKDSSSLPLMYIRAATVTKLMHLIRFAEVLDRECSNNNILMSSCQKVLNGILKQHQINKDQLLRFGIHYNSQPARILHSLLMSVLYRFLACREHIYNPSVCRVLDKLPKDLNFDSRFEPRLPDEEAIRVVADLRRLRNSYRRYMAATAVAIRTIFMTGRVWSTYTIPSWLKTAIEPFEKL